LKPCGKQLFERVAQCWPADGGAECVHLSCEFSVGPRRRQVDESFDVPDGLDIEFRNAVGERVDEAVEFCVGQGAVGVAIPFGQVSIEIAATEENLERASPSNQCR
jgi:hypothetical protein